MTIYIREVSLQQSSFFLLVLEDLSTSTWLLAGWEINKVMAMLMAVLEPAVQAELGGANSGVSQRTEFNKEAAQGKRGG